jgi:hypothetical protein
MTPQVTAQPKTSRLMDEVRRYLIAVDAFRAEGREPRWTPEHPTPTKPRRVRLDRG